MKAYLVATGCALAVSSASALAQGEAPAAPAPACYIEIQRLMAEPPEGIGELGAAIRELDVSLRPQVEEINVLKAQIARLERQAEAARAAPGAEPAEFGIEQVSLAPPVEVDPGAEEIQRLQAELGIKQDTLKLDYAAQQAALVGPVQERVSRGAQSFSATSGCPELKMVRTPDLAELTAAGARNVTGEFVAWYLSDRPG
jgi:hypothetical protein